LGPEGVEREREREGEVNCCEQKKVSEALGRGGGEG
jgi:hypothetical protein